MLAAHQIEHANSPAHDTAAQPVDSLICFKFFASLFLTVSIYLFDAKQPLNYFDRQFCCTMHACCHFEPILILIHHNPRIL